MKCFWLGTLGNFVSPIADLLCRKKIAFVKNNYLRQKYAQYFSEKRFSETQNFKIWLDALIYICLKLIFSKIGEQIQCMKEIILKEIIFVYSWKLE